MIFANENLSLYSLFAIVFLSSHFSASALRRLPPSRLRVSPPSRREAFTANVVTLVLLYCKQFCFRTSRPLSRSLPALVLLACRLPLSACSLRHACACHLPPRGRLLWAEKQRIICFSRSVVQRNKAHVMRLISVLCHAVLGFGGGYTMRLSIKKRIRVLRGKIRCKNGRM